MSLEAEEFKVVRAGEVAPVRGLRAFQLSATVLGFGALIYGGFFLYDLFSNITRGLQEGIDYITENPLEEVETVVNPAVITEEGIQEALRNFRPHGTGVGGSKVGYERALRGIAKKVNESGVGTLTNNEIRLMKKAEKQLVRSGMIDKRDTVKVHPVDRAASFVIRDKNYWGLVLGLMVVPALPVVAGIVRESMDK